MPDWRAKGTVVYELDGDGRILPGSGRGLGKKTGGSENKGCEEDLGEHDWKGVAGRCGLVDYLYGKRAEHGACGHSTGGDRMLLRTTGNWFGG